MKRIFQWTLCGMVCALLLVPTRASAFQSDAQVWAAPMAANVNQMSAGGHWGVGGQTGLKLTLSDFWSLTGGLEGSYHFESTEDGGSAVPSMTVANAFVGVRYNLDIFVYVPYIGFGVVGYLDRPVVNAAEASGTDPGLGVKLNLGVDYRYSRNFSFGVKAALHAADTDFGNFPAYSTIGLVFSYHFRL